MKLSLLVVLFSAVLFLGCVGYSQQYAAPVGTASVAASAASGTGGSSSETQVGIQGFAFSPAVLSVSAGTKVTWANLDSAPHTVTSTSAPEGGDFDSGTVSNGQSYSHVFSKVGTYEYRCSIHPSMTAKITVS